ncbi:MAG: hypothetical protein IIZ59_00320 [Clostridia bacterium]|nr:hypothetical protein [Clostridia bacterium]
MKNKKLAHVQDAMRAREAYDISERNLCDAWLYLRSTGVSAQRINAIDDEFYGETIPYFQKEADDGVIDVFIDRFLGNVEISRARVEAVVESRYHSRLARAFPTLDSYPIILDSLVTDLIMVLYQIHVSFGYGHTRLLRVLDYIRDYRGDEKQEVFEKLKIRYPDPQTLPDLDDLRLRHRKRQQRPTIDQEQLEQVQRDLDALRVMQGIS